MFYILLAIYLIIRSINFFWRSRRILKLSYQLRNKYIPLPFLGHGYMFLGSDVGLMNTIQNIAKESMKTGGLTAFWLGHEYYTAIADAEVAEIVLKTCLDKGDMTTFARQLVGNGTIFAPLKIWRPRRKILSTTFAPKNLLSFFDTFSKHSAVLVENLKRQPENEIFSIWKYLNSYTMDSVCETAFGASVENEHKKEFLVAFEELCQSGADKVTKPWLNIVYMFRKLLSSETNVLQCTNIIWKFLDELLTSIITDTMTGTPKTFLELLIKSGSEYSNVELREELLVIMLAGMDTTAVGASFTALILSRFPDVQDKVLKEICEVFGNSDRSITPQDLGRLKYLDAVIKETLRLYPPVPLIERKIYKDVTLPLGITLVENTGVVMNIWGLHRNPRYWGHDAEEFKPERFLDGTISYPNAYMPFSNGPRNCLGYQYAMMSMKIVLTTLLRRYELLPSEICDVEESQRPLRVKYNIMLRHVDNFSLRIQARE